MHGEVMFPGIYTNLRAFTAEHQVAFGVDLSTHRGQSILLLSIPSARSLESMTLTHCW